MKNTFKIAGYLTLITFFSCGNPLEKQEGALEQNAIDKALVTHISPVPDKSKKKIKLAILLDTSNSMDGLIEQAKNQLWKIVNQLAKAKDNNGNDPAIELALYQYGNDSLSVWNNYIEKVSGFTSELDEISEKLFGLKTNGGSEYCGATIKNSLEGLAWSNNKEDLQLIFIAGNEGFDQGLINYNTACLTAQNNNIIVNTIYCGNHNEGIALQWKKGADLTGGKYMNIDQDAKIVHIDSPFDEEISQLNTKLNNTYLPYGKKGKNKKQKQLKEDSNASLYGKANATKRYLSKGSKIYKNKSWDLVDAIDEKEFEINNIDSINLPEEMQNLTRDEKIGFIEKHKNERKTIQSQMKLLNKKRDGYVAKVKVEKAINSKDQLDDVVISSIIEQAKNKSFTFED